MPRRQPDRSASTPLTRAERRALTFFAAATVVAFVVWLGGFALRGAIWSVDIETIRLSGVFRVYGNTVSDLTNTFLLLAAASSAYAVALWALRKGFTRSFEAAIAGSTLLTLAVLPVTPLTSPDAIHFAADVRTLWLHGAYPGSGLPGVSSTVPAEVNDPIAAEVRTFKDAPSSYGPVAYGVSGIALPFVGDNVRANVFGVKVVAGVFLLLTAVLTGLVARRLDMNAGFATAFVGMNPLMLWQYPGDGHNDTIMAAFAMVALLFVVQTRGPQRLLGVGAAGASVLAKYALAAASPLIVAFWFPRWRLAVAAAVLVVGAVVSISFAFDIGVDLREIGPAAGLTRNTPWSVLSRKIDGTEATNDQLFCLGYLIFTVIAGLIVARHPLATAADLCAATALLMFAFLFIAAPSLRHWYQVWYLPFIPLCGARWLKAAALTFSLGGFGTILALNWSGVIRSRMGIENPADTSVIVLWCAVVVVAVAVGWYERSREQEAAHLASRRARAGSRRALGRRA